MRSWVVMWTFSLACAIGGICQAQVRELSLRAVEGPAPTTQPAGQDLPQVVPPDAKVARELRLAIECGHQFDISVTNNGATWHLSGMVQASRLPGDPSYRVRFEMELRSDTGVESIATHTVAQHGKDAVVGGLLGGGRSKLWVLRVSDPPIAGGKD